MFCRSHLNGLVSCIHGLVQNINDAEVVNKKYDLKKSNIRKLKKFLATLGGLITSLSNLRSGSCGFDPHLVWQHAFVDSDHEIFSMLILSLPLIQEGQLSDSGERMSTNTG